MAILDEQWLAGISHPSRYLGGEINSISKDPAFVDVSIALAFPDVYEVGMSHLGLKILYHLLNRRHWLAAERVFSPWVDLEKELRRRKAPLTTLETNRPLSDFDIVGFSLQHELSYTNVLNMLDLSGIPFLAKERKDRGPLIIGGGPACFNPEPMAEFFDLIVVGDGEDVALQICRTVRRAKQRKINKKELLSQLYPIKGVYVPSYFHIRYRPEGPVDTIEPLVPDYQVVEKAIVSDIDDRQFPDCQIVPFTELVHDRLAIEISRGCTRGCRFCQAGMIYRPVRERSAESILEKAQRALKLTGYEDLSLLSLSSGDYTCIEPLLKALMDRQSSEKVALSLPSLRINSLTPFLMEQIKRVRKTGFTLAPEAGSDRLRRIINKGMSREDILDTAREVYGAGWNLIKLYFMVGLPYEEERDLGDIVRLVNQVANLSVGKGKRPKLNVSISTFVPKSHTPFMWFPQIPVGESQRRIQLIHKGLKGSPVRVKWNQSELSWLEGVFSRGDRRLAKVITEAWKLGSRFDAWGECFQLQNWQEAFRRTGIDPFFYLHRERSPDEVLPWDHIRSGVTKDYLLKELERAIGEEFTPDCRKKCLKCGVCDHRTVAPVLYSDWKSPPRPEKLPAEPIPGPQRRYRLTFTKLDMARYLSHLELARVFVRAFRRAGLNLVHSRGYHPMPRVSFTCALPVGTESMQETMDIELADAINISSLRERINRQLPSGIDVNLVKAIPLNKQKARLRESYFHISLNGVELNNEDLDKFLRSEYFPVVKLNKKGEHEINARPLVETMRLISPNAIELTIKHTSGPELRPAEIVKRVFSLNKSNVDSMKILKTSQVLVEVTSQ